jgi:prephenate dehydrogenase
MKKRKPPVGIVGLGIMGGAMAEALLSAGHAVLGYDPAPEAARRLERGGGQALGSSTAVAQRASSRLRSATSAGPRDRSAGEESSWK